MLNAIEKAYIDAYRRREPQSVSTEDETSRWVGAGLYMVLDAGRLVREQRTVAGRDGVHYKDDGSPATRLEADIESLLRKRLAKFAPDASVVGEETGGALSGSGVEVAIDPIDGTWAFLSSTETYTTTLGVFVDGEPVLGMISNPTTGEIGYAVRGGEARLVRLSVFGEPDTASSLPEHRATPDNVLVNVHPNRTGGSVMSALYDAWRENGIRTVRSPGGSPSWALVEAARGAFVYLNLWSKKAAEPFDLAPGVLLVRAAGGEVMGLDGQPIDALRPRRPFCRRCQRTSAPASCRDRSRPIIEQLREEKSSAATGYLGFTIMKADEKKNHRDAGHLEDPALWSSLLSAERRGVEERQHLVRMLELWGHALGASRVAIYAPAVDGHDLVATFGDAAVAERLAESESGADNLERVELPGRFVLLHDSDASTEKAISAGAMLLACAANIIQLEEKLDEQNFFAMAQGVELVALYEVGLAIASILELEPLVEELLSRALLLLEASRGRTVPIAGRQICAHRRAGLGFACARRRSDRRESVARGGRLGGRYLTRRPPRDWRSYRANRQSQGAPRGWLRGGAGRRFLDKRSTNTHAFREPGGDRSREGSSSRSLHRKRAPGSRDRDRRRDPAAAPS